MISLKMFSDLIVPEYNKITKASKVPICWYSDGNIELKISVKREVYKRF
jgi:hypothetical protein